MFREKCTVLENKKVAPGHFVLRMRSPRISRNAKPGQFVQVLCSSDFFDPLLPRPFSFLTAASGDFSLLYHVVGKGTHLMSQAKKGESLWVVGPLGNGFSPSALSPQLALVGGGVGIPPLYHLAQEFLKKKVSREFIHVFLGARDKSLLLCEKDFKKLGVNLKVATDNGSKGRKGFVTEVLEDFLEGQHPEDVTIYTCGPTPMLKTVSAISEKQGISCEVSVEVPMACGFGACLGCAIKVKAASSAHRFAIACCEGPVFKGDEILWD